MRVPYIPPTNPLNPFFPILADGPDISVILTSPIVQHKYFEGFCAHQIHLNQVVKIQLVDVNKKIEKSDQTKSVPTFSATKSKKTIN